LTNLIDSNLVDLNSAEYPDCNSAHQVRGRPAKNSTSEQPKDYIIFDHQLIIPQYFVEYSLECDHDKQITRLERLATDIAYSNKLAHSSMPQIVRSMMAKFPQGSEPYERFNDQSLEKLCKDHPLITIGDSSKFHEINIWVYSSNL
jgi:hypothetical protein